MVIAKPDMPTPFCTLRARGQQSLHAQSSAGDAAGAGVYWPVSAAAAAGTAPSKPLPFSYTLKNRRQHGIRPALADADGTQHVRGKCCRGRGIARRSAPLYRTRTCARRSGVQEYTPSTPLALVLVLVFFREYDILVQHQGVLHVRAARAPVELYFHSVPLYNP